MLTVPASAEPVVSGVGVNATSMREILFIESCSMPTWREVPAVALATLKPFTLTGTAFGGTPFIWSRYGSPPPPMLTAMPGMALRSSPMPPSVIAEYSSAETTLMTLGAKRCVLMAMAEPSISFEVLTLN